METNNQQYRNDYPELVNIDRVRGGQPMPMSVNQPMPVNGVQQPNNNVRQMPNYGGQYLQGNDPQQGITGNQMFDDLGQMAAEMGAMRPKNANPPSIKARDIIPALMGIILAFIFKSSGGLAAMFLGGGFAGSGWMAFQDVPQYKRELKFNSVVTALCGGIFGIMGLLSLIVPSLEKTAAAGGLVLIGAVLAAAPLISASLKKRRCVEAVRAVCIGNRQKLGSGHRNMVYAPIWQYTLGGRAYTHYEDVYTNPPEFTEGQGADIMVNPNDPQDIMRKSTPLRWICTGIGVISAIVGIIMFLN